MLHDRLYIITPFILSFHIYLTNVGIAFENSCPRNRNRYRLGHL